MVVSYTHRPPHKLMHENKKKEQVHTTNQSEFLLIIESADLAEVCYLGLETKHAGGLLEK